MKNIFISIIFWVLNCCAIQAQETITLIPHLKNGDKIKMTTTTDSLPYTATYEVVDTTANQINFNFHSDYRKQVSKSSDIASLSMNLSHFGFATTQTGEFLKINNEQNVFKDYRAMMLEVYKSISSSLNIHEDTDEPFSMAKLPNLITQIYDNQTIINIAQFQSNNLFPLANETLVLGKSVSRKTTIPKTTTTPLSVYADMTYKLEEIQGDKIKVVVEYVADSDSLMNKIIKTTISHFKFVFAKDKDSDFVSLMEKLMYGINQKITMNLKIDYFFDLKIGLPIESFSVLNMGGVIGTKIEPNVETKFKTTFELIH